MSRWVAVAATGLLVAGLGALALLRAPGPVGPGGAPRDDGEDDGPRIALLGVEFRDEGEDGDVARMLADEAVYSIRAKTVAAGGVTLFLPGRRGESVVSAKSASWNLETQRVDLPEGCAGRAPDGWSAAVARGRLDLREKIFESVGEATIEGPGLVVRGTRLAWRWKDGTLSLEKPVSRIASDAVARRKG